MRLDRFEVFGGIAVDCGSLDSKQKQLTSFVQMLPKNTHINFAQFLIEIKCKANTRPVGGGIYLQIIQSILLNSL